MMRRENNETRALGIKLLAATLLAVGCQGILGIEDWTLRTEPSESCTLNSDCESGFVCLFERCSKECEQDRDCLPGFRCLVTDATDTTGGHACVSQAQAACARDEQCPPGTSCRDQSCRRMCDDPEQCLGDQTCTDGTCVGNDPERDPLSKRDGGMQGSGGADASMGGGAGGAPEGDGGSGGTGVVGESTVGSVGQPCSPNDALGCTGYALKGQLICASGRWAQNGTCSGANNCDTTPGTSNTGSCQPIVSECSDAIGGALVCSDRERFACGPDLVTRLGTETCAGGCVEGQCTECHPGDRQCVGLQRQACDASGQWQNDGAECPFVCSGAGQCTGDCVPGTGQCKAGAQVPQLCSEAGLWQDQEPCASACVASDGAASCSGVCLPGAQRCNNNRVQECNAAGAWVNAPGNCTTANQTCVVSGAVAACQGVCAAGQTQCSGNGVQTCTASGQWGTAAACPTNRTCLSGTCGGVCGPGQRQCSGNGAQTCTASGQWGAVSVCTASSPHCSNGTCGAPPSCQGLASNCNGESCCTSLLVPGGTYNRSNNASYPATVSNFRLDRYEVTVGRFRRFVQAWADGWRPSAGAGKHSHLNGGSGLSNSGASGTYESGWNTSWTANLATTSSGWNANLLCDATNQTWTSVAGANETMPINCVHWFDGYAFCIWDGGFLPSEAEWNYAAAGGSEQRNYPWVGFNVNCSLANYRPTNGTCGGAPIAVGSFSPNGDGRYGHADLAGNVQEWNLDWLVSPYAMPCNNCAYLTSASSRMRRGGSFSGDQVTTVLRSLGSPTDRRGNNADVGIRCARAP